MHIEDNHEDVRVLIRACAESPDSLNWERFIARFQRVIGLAVMRTARRCACASPDVIAEIVQETYLKLCDGKFGLLRRFVDEHPAAPYEIRIYRGANGAFSLYEDAGDGYDYEHGAFALVDFTWNDARSELTIGARKGGFDGLVASRDYLLVFISSTGRETKRVGYSGGKIKITV